MKTVLEVNKLTKNFTGAFSINKWKRGPGTVAVDRVSFKIGEGEIVGLLGANGAGKTTTTQLILGTTTKTSGEVRVFGKNFDENRSEILKQMNYASAYARLPWRLTVRENLLVHTRLYEVKDGEAKVEKFLKAFSIDDYIDKRFGSLSAGQKTRVILAKAFLNHPRLLLLDEPTASLDPDIAGIVRTFLLEQQKKYGVAMLFTSHNMAEVSEVCDRVIVLKKGKIVAEDSPEGLAKRIKQTRVRLMIVDGMKRLRGLMKKKKWHGSISEREVEVTVEEEKVAAMLKNLAAEKIEYSSISIDKASLEDYFLALSRGEEV